MKLRLAHLTPLLLVAGCSSSGPGHRVDTLFPIADARVVKEQPQVTFGTDSFLEVGRNPSGEISHAYMQFDLSGLPADGRLIRKATLVVGDEARDIPGTLHSAVRANIEAWSESSIRWNLRPAFLPKVYASLDADAHTPLIWDVTELVRDTRDGVVPDHGWLLSTPSHPGGFFRFWSREHPTSPYYWIVVDPFELLHEATVDSTGRFTLSVSEARVGVEHYYYAGTTPKPDVQVADPPKGWVDIDAPVLLGYGKALSSTDTFGVDLRARFPGATTVITQVVARDGDEILVSNPVEVQL